MFPLPYHIDIISINVARPLDLHEETQVHLKEYLKIEFLQF